MAWRLAHGTEGDNPFRRFYSMPYALCPMHFPALRRKLQSFEFHGIFFKQLDRDETQPHATRPLPFSLSFARIQPK
jgi:hypothetical protein